MQRWVGTYVGKPGPRPGREADLSPAERKRFVGGKEVSRLELHATGCFTLNGTVEGKWSVQGAVLRLQPERFRGRTRREQAQESAREGREFRLAFVFDAFELGVVGETLVEPGNGVITTVYVRAECST